MRSTYEMVSVVEHDLAAEAFNLVWCNALEGALSADRHEDGCIDWAMGQSQDRSPGLCGAAFGEHIPCKG